jgi:transcriptional regulator with XRE-family HTH domain
VSTETGQSPDSTDGLRRRLRAERVRRGLSVRRLAADVGISPSALSQIETGKARPSVTTLYAIVSTLGLSFDGLFADGDHDAPRDGQESAPPRPPVCVRRAGARRSIEFTTGIRWDRLSPSGDAVQVLQLAYPPGAASGEGGRLSRHSGREYGIVLQGRMAVSIAFETYELGVGDAIAFASSRPHQLRAVGSEVALALWFVVSEPPYSAMVHGSSRAT